ncbi:MAG: hypothetical protein WC415_04060 [Patescibacteria group bacterium]|jgi:hypothetical protein
MIDIPTDVDDNNTKEIEAYFNLFKEILPMGNWRVILELVNSHDLSHYIKSPDAYGACNKNRNTMYATIYINEDKPRVDEYGETWEFTLLHEMLHLVIDDFMEYIEMKSPEIQEDTFFQIKKERLINLLSYSFFAALTTNINEQEVDSLAEVNRF